MMNITFLCMFVVVSISLANCEIIVVGDEVNATYPAKEFTDIHGFLYAAIQRQNVDVRIAVGTYYMSDQLSFTSNNILRGTVTDDGTVLTTLKCNSSRVVGLALISAFKVQNVTIQGFNLDGVNVNSSISYELNGIAVTNGTDIVIDNMSATAFKTGLLIQRSVNVTVSSLVAWNNVYDGVLVASSSNFSISGSTITNSTRHGMSFVSVTGARVQYNIISDNGALLRGCAIIMNGSIEGSVISNSMENNARGICMPSTTNLKVSENTITVTQDTECISASPSSTVETLNNTCISTMKMQPKNRKVKSDSIKMSYDMRLYLVMLVVTLLVL